MKPTILLGGLALAWNMALGAALFEETTTAAGIAYHGAGWSAAWRDYDNDGDADLWTSNHGGRPTLYLNLGDGRFQAASNRRLQSAVRDGHAAAWADMDNDGDADLMEVTGAVLGSGAGANQLFRNDDGVLTDIAPQAGVDYPLGRGRVPLWLDYDNDGRLDLLILNQSRADDKAPSALFHNEGERFRRTGPETGLALPRTANDTFAILTELQGGLPMELVVFGTFPPPFAPRIYDYASGRFQEVTASLMPRPYGDLFDAVSGDFNGDLRPDLLLMRYRYQSDLVRLDDHRLRAGLFNNGTRVRGLRIHTDGDLQLALHLPTVKWRFDALKLGARQTTRAPERTHIISGYFSLSSRDPEVRGAPDLGPARRKAVYLWFDADEQVWELRFTSESWAFLQLEITSDRPIRQLQAVGFTPPEPLQPVLLLSQGDGYREAPLPRLPSCPSAASGDFDNDGDLDLYLVCTRAIQNRPNQLLLNDGHGRFRRVNGHGAEGTHQGVGQKAAVADYDNDGHLDLFVINGLGPASPLTRGPYQLFRNLGGQGHWLEIRLEGVRVNRDGLGAQVRLTAGGKTQLREQNGMSHYGAQDDQRLHFGLGDAQRVERLEVLWPDGSRQTLQDLGVDRVLTIRQETAEP